MAAITYHAWILRSLTLGLAALVLALPAPVGASHGDIHATCEGDRPVIRERPPGTEHVHVICVRGLPEFTVSPLPMPLYNPILQNRSQVVPPDFGGWVTVWLNGHPLKTPYDPVRHIQEPGAYLAASTGRVMMPVRFFTAAFGGTVNWKGETGRVQLLLRDKLVQLWIGQREALVNGQIASLSQPPILFLDRTFVPVRFLLESFDAKVQWDGFNKSARITLDGAQCLHPVYCGEVR